MILILVRHGNTFSSGDKVVWVGKGEDLPLVKRGEEQASEVAEALRPLKFSISSLLTGPLMRAKGTAEIIREELSLKDREISIDPRLDEIDYGEWGGKSNDELLNMGFQKELEEWNSRGIYPHSAGWGVSEEELMERADSFLTELSGENLTGEVSNGGIHIAITSNGILRYFLRQIPSAYKSYADKGLLKVRTGAISVFRSSRDGESSRWEVLCWNVLPSDFDAQILEV